GGGGGGGGGAYVLLTSTEMISRRLTFCLFPGEVLVIGSNLPIIAAPGDDVILPCHLEPTFDVQGLTVEWSKPNLKHGKEVPDMKMASYFRRTELFMDDMKHGNISLKILNVSEEDNGRYRCFIPKLQSRNHTEFNQINILHICVRRDIRKTAITSVLKDSIYLKHRMNKKIFNTQKSKDQTLLFSSLKQLTSYRCEITAYSKMTKTC
uniref:Ig-like domain-containing protein n=1 Tax=Maylandia zebra TaxID=106582 RepID=A0A3P9AUG2_9CICH